MSVRVFLYTFPERELVYVLSINIRLSGFGGCRNTPQGMGIEIVENSKSKICLPTLYQLTYFVMNPICPLSKFQFPHPKVKSVRTLCTRGDCSYILFVFYVFLTVPLAMNIFGIHFRFCISSRKSAVFSASLSVSVFDSCICIRFSNLIR